MLDRRVLGAGVVLGDPDQRGGQHQADGASAPQPYLSAGAECVVGHHLRGDEVEGDQRQTACHCQALVERRHHVLHARRGLDEAAADDRRDDRHPTQQQRIDHRSHLRRTDDCQCTQCHRGNQCDGIGLEQVGRHAGAVTDVVTDVVSDHRRVARIILGDAGFDLAHQVGTDVGALGEDATAQSREDRDQRRAEGKAQQRLEHG